MSARTRHHRPQRATARALLVASFALIASQVGAAGVEPGLPLVPHERFETAVREAVAPSAAASLAGLKVLHLSADVGPWLDTGLPLVAGQPVTMLMSGQVHWSRAAKLGLSPQFAVWGRIGEQGTIFNGSRGTHGFVADSTGSLQLKLFPGLGWTSLQGSYEGEPPAVNPDGGGGISVALLAWKPGTDPAAALRGMEGQALLAPFMRAESRRLAEGPAPVPPGWQLMWELGRSEIFTHASKHAGASPGPVIQAHTHDDVGILQKDAPFDLKPGTRLNWRWQVDALPSTAPENTVPTHDYLSIAVEFDNGRDITFMWSHSLPEGEIFACPLPAWQARETHWVLRSGKEGLGRWHDESVDLHTAYQRAIGGELPKRITRVWLIANSMFQKREGMAQFTGIELTDGQQRLALP